MIESHAAISPRDAARTPGPYGPSAKAQTECVVKCRLCGVRLSPGLDDFRKMLCADCKDRPEAKSASQHTPAASRETAVGRPSSPAAQFTDADLALIRKVGGLLSPGQLLEVLNERLRANKGSSAAAHTMQQLHDELRKAGSNGALPHAAVDSHAHWAGLRKLIAEARRNGTLGRVSQQLIDDFAIVFALTPPQVLRLKDVLLPAARSAK